MKFKPCFKENFDLHFILKQECRILPSLHRKKTKCNIYLDFRVIFSCNKSYLHAGKIYFKLKVMVTISNSLHLLFFNVKKPTSPNLNITHNKNYSSVFFCESKKS